MDIKQINTAIITGNWNDEQLMSMIDAVKFARSRLQASTIRTLRLGTTVRFTSNKTGVTHKGTVEKIAIKYVTVNTGAGRWKVPANMLEVV